MEQAVCQNKIRFDEFVTRERDTIQTMNVSEF